MNVKTTEATLEPTSQQYAQERQFVIAFLLCVALVLFSQVALAAPEDTPMGFVLCSIVKMVYGNLGRGLATLAVIIIGVGATLGKVTWGLAMTVAVGISVIFNAGAIVDLLDGEGGFAGC